MNSKYLEKKILILDDDEDDFIIISDYIFSIPGSKFQLDWCNKYEEGLKHLLNCEYDLYFVDYRLGAKTGIDFLKDASNYHSDEPIVLLTGMGNYNIDVQSMNYGAVDYLVKTELTTEKLERCIRYAIGRATTLKALKEKEKKYRSIFEKSKDVVFVTDCQLNFKEVNPAIYNLLGYEKDEVIKMNLNDLFEKDQIKNNNNLLSKKPIEINDNEIVFVTKDGEKKQCTLTLTAEEPENSVSDIQGIIHDITNLKMIEKVTIQTEKMAAAGRLLRTLAHEVRNPLNNISLSTEQLQHDINSENSTVYLDIIQRNSKRISDLITELLNTSRPATIKLQKTSLQAIIEDVVSAAIDRITLRNIKLSISIQDSILYILADKDNLKLALLNIVINAIDAVEDELGKLSITIEQDNDKAILLITDNGCGISEENLPRLFEPFYTQKRNGVGLGLTFTLNILQAHNAKIDVVSNINNGTTFKIIFYLV